jgi:hypothetical protein
VAEHRWSLLCYRGVVDKYSNLLSLVDVTDELTLEPLPEPLPENVGVPVNFHLVSMWVRSDPKAPELLWSGLKIVTPDGGEFVTGDPLAISLVEHPRTRLIFRFQAIPFKGTGIYRFVVGCSETQDGEQVPVADVPLEIKIQEQTSSTEPEQPSGPIPSALPASS